MSFTAKIVGRDSVTVFINGQMYQASTGHINYAKLREAVNDDDADTFLENYEVIKSNVVAGTGLEIVDNNVYYNGEVLHGTLCERLLSLVKAGKNVDSLVKFLDNLALNPSKRSKDELYDFLEHKNMPITDDGCFLAYKSVRSDWYSKASGKLKLLQGRADNQGHIFNGIGEIIECSRNEVDDERQNECSVGLHVGCASYSAPGGWYNSAGDKVLIVKVNPKDCVSVPKDHNATKLRTCKYEVVSEFTGGLNKPVYETGEEYSPDVNYSEDGDYDYTEELSIRDIYEEDCITFTYEGKTRYAEVLGVHDDHFHTKLMAPEDKCGEYRNFVFDKIESLRIYE